MSRKRFIKLLMSHGISRNKAVELANYYNRRNIPYERAYKKVEFNRLGFKFEGFARNFSAAGAAALDNIVSAFKRALSIAVDRKNGR